MDEELGPSGGGGGGADFISALPDDLLLQVLSHLGCIRAAACTGILSRRWRGLWTHLPKATVALHDVPFGSLEAALRRATRPGACHYRLDIRVPGQDDDMVVDSSSVSSLLHAAAGLSPVELRFTLPRNLKVSLADDAELPCFRRATSIELQAEDLHFWQGQGTYTSLERFSVSGCHIPLHAFIPRCPRLRELRVNSTGLMGMGNIIIHSPLLEELVVENRNHWIARSRISVHAPVLKQLAMSFHAHGPILVSILAPMLKKVSWECLYTRVIYGFCLWGLIEVGLNMSQSHRQTDSPEGAYVLSLHMCAQDTSNILNAELSLASEIEKHMVTNLSALDLYLTAKGHVFGAFVLHLLGMHRIRTAIQSLKIVLLRSEVKDACTPNCLCDEPNDWRTQSISLVGLEKLEIEGVEGEDHEFDFLKAVFECAPMLKTVTVKLSNDVTPSVDWCTKINNILLAYPVMECTVDLGPGSTNNSQRCVLT